LEAVTMNAFDKLCATFAFAFGVGFLVLGIIGLFVGCRANFTLPPILGVLPAIVGWGIIRSVYFGWKRSDVANKASIDELVAARDEPRKLEAN